MAFRGYCRKPVTCRLYLDPLENCCRTGQCVSKVAERLVRISIVIFRGYIGFSIGKPTTLFLLLQAFINLYLFFFNYFIVNFNFYNKV